MTTEKIAVHSADDFTLYDAEDFHLDEGHLYVTGPEAEMVAVYAPGAWQAVSREPVGDPAAV
jgi:hypothetical protein